DGAPEGAAVHRPARGPAAAVRARGATRRGGPPAGGTRPRPAPPRGPARDPGRSLPPGHRHHHAPGGSGRPVVMGGGGAMALLRAELLKWKRSWVLWGLLLAAAAGPTFNALMFWGAQRVREASGQGWPA